MKTCSGCAWRHPGVPDWCRAFGPIGQGVDGRCAGRKAFQVVRDACRSTSILQAENQRLRDALKYIIGTGTSNQWFVCESLRRWKVKP